MLPVRAERTGWRDQSLSQRHRIWGYDCPAVDIDFLLIEYDAGKVCGLVEYKNEHANIGNTSGKTFEALTDLGNRARCPVFVCWYSDDFSWFKVKPLNQAALKYLPKPYKLNEVQYVKLLYKLRGREAPEDVLKDLKP